MPRVVSVRTRPLMAKSLINQNRWKRHPRKADVPHRRPILQQYHVSLSSPLKHPLIRDINGVNEILSFMRLTFPTPFRLSLWVAGDGGATEREKLNSDPPIRGQVRCNMLRWLRYLVYICVLKPVDRFVSGSISIAGLWK